jgi:hypothetical protein
MKLPTHDAGHRLIGIGLLSDLVGYKTMNMERRARVAKLHHSNLIARASGKAAGRPAARRLVIHSPSHYILRAIKQWGLAQTAQAHKQEATHFCHTECDVL